jgi:nucleoside phosphorylase
VSAWDQGTRRVDVVILTAIRLEFDAVRAVAAGAVAGSVWETVPGPSGLPVAFRAFAVDRGRPLRVAVALAPDMGATAAVNTLLPLVNELAPRCIAMCGVCAGRRGKVQLGDVVAADRLYYHDTGKQLSDQVLQDLTTYKLRDDWKAALEGMHAVARFRDEAWFQARPLTSEWREHRALVALRDGGPEPWKAVDPALDPSEWHRIVTTLRERKWLEASGRGLTDQGRRAVDDLLFEHMNQLPDLSPSGSLYPFRLHVAPIGSGARVIEDEAIWSFVSRAMRKTLGLEMEAAALGELAHRQHQYQLDAVVMKGVMDFADHGRDDHFKEFAARASAECLLWFLRENLPTEVVAGFDDVLAPGALPMPRRTPAPSVLLDARYAVVPWHETGRTEVLADLDAWADDPAHAACARLLHAEGGAGKTRLAIEWVRRRRERHDVAGFLLPDPDDGWLERLCGLGAPVLIVIDYAESRADLVAVLERVARYAAVSGPRRRIRILLLARNDGDWWHALLQHGPRIAALLTDREPAKLTPLAVTAAEREAVFAEAARVFAAARHRTRAPAPPIALDDARFERALYLHMAALAAVEGSPGKPADAAAAPQGGFDASSLMDRVLDHEERFWIRQASDRSGNAVAVPLARQLVAAATLRGGLTREDARALCVRLEDRPRTDRDDAVIALLHDIYDIGDPARYLPGLEPDLLGEAMVLRIAAPPRGAGAPAGDAWIERVLVAGDDAQALTIAFTVLGRASATDSTAVGPWIERLLGTELALRAVLALRAAKAVGLRTATSMLGDLLTDALECDGTVAIAHALAHEGIPYPTTSLRRLGEWQVSMQLEDTPAEPDPRALEARAELLGKQGGRLFDLGEYEGAFAATWEAVEIFRGLAARSPDEFEPLLAGCLCDLGAVLSALGKLGPALAATREAVDLFTAHAARDRVELAPDLARSLHSLGNRLRDMGQREEALAYTRRAVDFYRALAEAAPEAYQGDLANSLNSFGILLSELGRFEPALAPTREAAELYRALAAQHPDAFAPALVKGLTNLGNRLSELGQDEDALAAAREAVELCRTLASRNPEAFEPDLATGLHNLGVHLWALGLRDASLAATREAVDLRRKLVARTPGAFEPDVAMSLTGLGVHLSEQKQHDEALAALREAVDLRRALAAGTPGAFEPELAYSLNHLGHTLDELERYDEALATTRDAVELYRALAARNPELFERNLASNLRDLGLRWLNLDRPDAALPATREAAALLRALAARQPDVFQPDLARALCDLSFELQAVGEPEPAIATAREAIELHRALAAKDPGAFQPQLAFSLFHLGRILTALGRFEDELIAVRETVDVCRVLAAHDPDFQPELAENLDRLGDRLRYFGHLEPAVAMSREAVELYRALAAKDPAFQHELAKSVHNLGARLNEFGDHEAALATTREAVSLGRELAAKDPAYQRELAMSLNNLGSMLQQRGTPEPALAALREAVELYRRLAIQDPAFQPDLARCSMLLDQWGAASRADQRPDRRRSTISGREESLPPAREPDAISGWSRGTRPVDVVILTAIRLEFDAVLQVDAGAVPGSAWERATGPSGLPVAYRSFVVGSGRPLRTAVVVAPDMGTTAAVNTLLPLIEALAPRCIAMCGVCAGRRGKVELGDVVAADRLYFPDTGTQRPDEVQQDLTTCKLRDDWKAALEGMDPAARFRDERWFQARPLTTEWRLARALAALRDGVAAPWTAVDPTSGTAETWQQLVAALRKRGLVAASGRTLKKAGKSFLDKLLIEHRGALPDLSPTGALHPFRLHVAPIGSGTRVIEDEQIWTFVSQAMRKTLGLQMEAAAVGELAHRLPQRALDWVVMKGVMDFADHGRDDHFQEFAARASAECLLWFLRERVPTEAMAGFDDLLAPGTLRLPDRALPPSLLLDARYEVVPWREAGRSEILADLDAWADDRSRPIAVQLLHAEGGAGKTRLASEWVRRRRARYDAAGFLVPAPDARWLERLCVLGAPVIAILDDAERRADLVAVLQRVAALAAPAGQHPLVRVLLLARNDGDWWKALPLRDPAIAALVGAHLPIQLAPLAATAVDREAVFAEASRAFAARRGPPPVLRSPIPLDDVRFEHALYLHMAALAAVEGTAAPDAGSLMDEVLAHEERFWLRAASDRASASIDLSLARQLVAAATLCGELATWNEACDACERLARRPRSREDDALIALLHDIYDPGDRARYLPGLEPDLLGEALVLRVAQPPPEAGPPAGDSWIERVVPDDAAAHAVTTAFTVLGRASATNPEAVWEWISALLQRRLASRAVLALRAAKAIRRWTAYSPLGDLLADALELDGSIAIAVALAEEQIPQPTAGLLRVAEWQSRVRLAHAPAGDDEPSLALRAALRLEHGNRLGDLGEHAAALAATQEAVDAFRTLAALNPELRQTALAGSLNSLGRRLRAVGDRAAALTATQEAVALYRALADRSPAAFRPDLALGLRNLGMILSQLGQHAAALIAIQEAVALRRALAAENPDVSRADLAASLANLGTLLRARGEHRAALDPTRESVALLRALAARHADVFQADVASSTTNLSNLWSELGDLEAALAAAREAVELSRALVARYPEAFRDELANSLHILGTKLRALGQHEAALAAAREAVGLYRSLAAGHPRAFRTELAGALHNLGIMYSELGQCEAALAATREVVELRRELAARYPEVFEPELASSLGVLSAELFDLKRTDAALAAIRETVALYRTLAARDPAFRRELASNLHNLNVLLTGAGEAEAALAALSEAADLYRTLAADAPEEFEPELASSAHILGGKLLQLGRGEDALDATDEAVALYHTLAARDPEAFEPALASCLNFMGSVFDSLGEPGAALEATRDAVTICRALAAKNPALRPQLARTLTDLGERWSAVDKPRQAVTAIREAVTIYRALAAADPDAFQPGLAIALERLSAPLNALGHYKPALAASREVVALYRGLAARDPGAFQPLLAMSVYNLSIELNDSGSDAALEPAREAVELYRPLAGKDPDAFRADLADSLNNLSYTLAEMWQAEPALAAGREAVYLYRMVAAERPEALQPGLARALQNLSSRLLEMGQREASLAATREAIDIFRALTVKHPAFQRELERNLHLLELRSGPGALQARSSILGGFDDLPPDIAALASDDVDRE